MSICIDLREDEIRFLRMFAEKHFPGADDNLGTCQPIHIVERQQKTFVQDDSEEVFVNYDTDEEYEDLDSLAEAKGIPKYEDVEYEDVNGVWIADCEDYFKAHAIKGFCSGQYIISWRYVAAFFIRSEAERYMNDYQKHNCDDCRIYTYSPGYANEGDYPVFYELLMRLGKEILRGEPH